MMPQKILMSFVFSLCLLTAFSQNTYYMSNGLIEECEGILKDSEANEDFPGYYNHDEHFILTICVDNPGDFELYFTEFHTEEDFDFFNVYEGIGTGGNLVASYTGFGIPPSLQISGVTCITIEFISDSNVAEFGWTMFWEVEVQEPEAPMMQLLNEYSCEDLTMTVVLTDSILCDSVSAANFSIVGPGPVGIASVEPLNCVNGMTNQIQINLAPEITVGGNYQLRLISYIYDACDELHQLFSIMPLLVDDCPMVVLLSTSPACIGDCFDVEAEVFGGDGNYSYNWSPAAPNSNQVNVCIQPGETVSVTVTDGGGVVAMESITPTFYPNPVILNLPSDTICRSSARFDLQADPPGGSWTATGIHPNNAWNGRYEPWRTNGNTGNPDLITYTDTNGCTVDTTITVLFIDRGNNDGACLGANPFNVSGGTPAGGSWSGTGIDASGVFTPDTEGNFFVTYTAPNGCSWGKTIFVNSSISFNGPDTVCNTGDNFRVIPSPRGGQWQNHPSGWTHSEWFQAWRFPAGDNQLIYQAEGQGCVDTFDVFVKQIFIDQNSMVLCPEALGNQFDVPFNPSITGGTWTGTNVIDPVQGTVDVSNASNGDHYQFRYTADGCYVNSEIYFVSTTVDDFIGDTSFCLNEDAIEFRDLIDFSPNYATISGNGITTNQAGDTIWDPSLVNGNTASVQLEANGCVENFNLYIYDVPELLDDQICALDDPFELNISTGIISVTGPGIIFEDSGLLDPGQASVGYNYYTLISDNQCTNLDSIEVVDLVLPEINALDPFYCFKDTVLSPVLNPAGGALYLDGVLISDFNPSELAEGAYSLQYVVGTGNCMAAETEAFVILPPLSLEAISTLDTVCVGESVRISAEPSGGFLGGSYRITWGGNLGFGQVHYVSPTGPSEYIVRLEDGCSDPVWDTLNLDVHPDFTSNISYNQIVCADDTTFVQIDVQPQGEYSFLTGFGEIDSIFYSQPRNFRVTIRNEETGCVKDRDIVMPAYEPVAANFSLFPSGCINTADRLVEVTDLSNGGVMGEWYLNDSLIANYVSFQDLDLEFDEDGNYELKLIVANEGNCRDSITKEICVEDFVSIQVPNAFTPNGDSVNDRFQFHSIGVKSAVWRIFDRYGKLVFESEDYTDSWDGRVENEDPESGHYLMVLEYETNAGKKGSNKYSVHLIY